MLTGRPAPGCLLPVCNPQAAGLVPTDDGDTGPPRCPQASRLWGPVKVTAVLLSSNVAEWGEE